MYNFRELKVQKNDTFAIVGKVLLWWLCLKKKTNGKNVLTREFQIELRKYAGRICKGAKSA